MDKLAALSKFEVYSQAPPDLRREMLAAARLIHAEPGTIFVREGDKCPQFAIIAAGRLRVFKIGENGREITLYQVIEGQTCLANMVCAFLDAPCPATAVVDEPLDALVVPAAMFREWIRTQDVIRQHVFTTIITRLMDLMSLVEEVSFRKMDRRLADFLLRRFPEGKKAIMPEVNVTHEEIASELGSAREVVSRLLKEFERVGAVDTARGRIVLRDKNRLQRLSQGGA